MGEGRAIAVVLRDLLPPAGPRSLLPVRTLVDLAALADRLGYHSVWVPEGRGRELDSMLGAMAQATVRIGLASGILPLYSRPPALVAMAAATLADLSGGRFVLGIGAGHPAIIEQGYGVSFREPLLAAREFVAIVRTALAGERVSMRGRVFEVDAFQLEAKPDHPVPIYLAALGPAMLRMAGEVADGVILNWTSPEHIPWAVARVREGAARAGRGTGGLLRACGGDRRRVGGLGRAAPVGGDVCRHALIRAHVRAGRAGAGDRDDADGVAGGRRRGCRGCDARRGGARPRRRGAGACLC
jgi:alkanesulfonate monooxygenase SsuD/methylene tetrahydromethanopterin reductase-like flavin-dependent oxidoreductase (luciferase family)